MRNSCWEGRYPLVMPARQNFHIILRGASGLKTLGMLNYCSLSLRERLGFGSLTPPLHKVQEAAGETSAGTGRTRSASPGRPEATAGGATRGASLAPRVGIEWRKITVRCRECRGPRRGPTSRRTASRPRSGRLPCQQYRWRIRARPPPQEAPATPRS